MPFRKYPPGESDAEWADSLNDLEGVRDEAVPAPRLDGGVFVDGGHIRAVEVEGQGVRVTLAAASKAASAAVDVVLDRGQAIDLGVSLIKGALGQEPEPEAVER